MDNPSVGHTRHGAPLSSEKERTAVVHTAYMVSTGNWAEWKTPIPKHYTLRHSIYMPLLQNSRSGKQTNGCSGLGKGEVGGRGTLSFHDTVFSLLTEAVDSRTMPCTSTPGKIWTESMNCIDSKSLVEVRCYSFAKRVTFWHLDKVYTRSLCVFSYRRTAYESTTVNIKTTIRKKEKRGPKEFLLEITCEWEPYDHCRHLQKLLNPHAGKLTNSPYREMVNKAHV